MVQKGPVPSCVDIPSIPKQFEFYLQSEATALKLDSITTTQTRHEVLHYRHPQRRCCRCRQARPGHSQGKLSFVWLDHDCSDGSRRHSC